MVVQVEGSRPVEWVMKVSGDGPWQLRLESPDGGEVAAASGDNVFEMVREIGRSLAPRGVTLCVNGARVDTRPSGLSASHGAWMVYVLRLWRPPTVRDLVPTLGYAEPSGIGSVEQQDAYWDLHLRRRRSWLNRVNPVWWAYVLTASRGWPRGFGRGPG